MSDLFLLHAFSMVSIRGSGSGAGYLERTGPSDEEIRGIIVAKVAEAIKEVTP